MLSGFLITYLLIEEKVQTGKVDVLRFWIRRIFRIWPLFYFSVAFGFFGLPIVKSFFGQIKTKNRFDIVFFDPPFADDKYKEYLKLVKKLKILNKKNLVIIHREKKSLESFENILKVLLSKNYGRSKVIFGVI